MFDSFGPRLIKTCEASDAAAANRVIGSCSFLLAGHGDLRIEWEETDHDEIVKLIQTKIEAGVHFFTLDPASLRWAPIKRANRAMGREVYVCGPDDVKRLIEGGFGRFPTTRYEGIGQIKILGIAKSAEEAARAVAIATSPMRGAESDLLIGAKAIALFLRELGVQPKPGKGFTERTVYNWAHKDKLPVKKMRNSTVLVANKSGLRQWFDELGRRTDPTVRLMVDWRKPSGLCSRGRSRAIYERRL